MSAIRSYRDLQVWQAAMGLAQAVYAVTRRFPREEAYGLISQMRRAAVSIPSNIAEGHGRVSRKEFQHHVAMARGSLAELETQLILAARLGYIEADSARELWATARDVGRLINGLLRSLVQ